MRGDFAVRVVAAHFVTDVNPRNLQIPYRLRSFHVKLTLDVDETTVTALVDSLPDGFFIRPHEFSEFSDLRAACFSGFFRYGPDASCRDRGSKHHAVTVHNLTALRGH